MRITLALLASVLALATPALTEAMPKGMPKPPLPAPLPKIVYGKCPGLEEAAGCYLGDVIYVLDRRSRFAKLHELGHAYDALMMDAGERNRFARLADMNDLLWTWSDDDGGVLVQGVGTPAERFADAYATCRMGLIVAPRHLWMTGYGYYPTARQHRRICGVIARAGRDQGAMVSADGDR